jgi:hypothetical protein
MKQKTCKICKAKFTNIYYPLAVVCNPICAQKYSAIHLKKSELKKERIKKKENKVKKLELKPKSYWLAILQKEINQIVRLIDKGCPCISSGRPYRTDDQCGHYFSIGSTPALRFNLLNLWSQSIKDNMHNSGNLLNYREQLVKFDIIDLIEDEKRKYPTLKLSIEEIKEAISKAKIVKKLMIDKNNDVFAPRSVQNRVNLRVEFNKYLEIYK